MHRVIIILLCSIVSLSDLYAGTIYTKEDKLIFDKYVEYISRDVNTRSDSLIIKTAKFFLGKPYVGSTLEKDGEEKLVVNLREFDCTTFVETCLALSAMVRSGDISFEEYCRQLAMLRYRNGQIEGYTSRLHYSSDWINENENREFWKNISLSLGGEIIAKNINYMSTHPQAYRHLKDNSYNVNRIRKIEQTINNKNNYRVIPKDKISTIEELIRDGDVILFASSIKGLDYSHLGIAYRKQGKLYFIHASSKFSKVIVEPRTLVGYCSTSKRITGISLIRLKD